MRLRLAASAVAITAILGLSLGTVATVVPAQAATHPVLYGQIDKWESQIQGDDSEFGIKSGIVGTFLYWNTVLPSSGVNWFNWVRGRGGVPMLDLMPPASATLGQIAAGGQDSCSISNSYGTFQACLKGWAAAIKAYGHPVLIRLLPEMNATESYEPGTRGQTAAQYIAAWRHVVTLFRSAGASNAAFMFNPYWDYEGSPAYKSFWPGAAYVNWVGLDLYNFADKRHGTLSPYQLAEPSVKALRAIAPHQPLIIAELGTAQYAGKPNWVKSSTSTMQSLGALAVVWFQEVLSGQPNWRFDTSSASKTAAIQMLHSSNVTYAGKSSLAQLDHLVEFGSWGS